MSPYASLRVGQRADEPAAGRPHMAWAPEAQLRQWLAQAPADLTDPTPFLSLLKLVRSGDTRFTLQNPVKSQLGEVIAKLSASPMRRARAAA